MCACSDLSDSVQSPGLYVVACQAALSMALSRQEYGSGLPFPALGDLPSPEMEPESPSSLALAGGFFIISTTWKAPLINELILFLAALGFSYNLQDLSLWCTDSSQQQTHFPLVEVLQACGTQA